VEKTGADPDAYLATLPDDVRPTMEALDELVSAALPGRERSLWAGTFWGGTDQTIIGYGEIVQPRPRGDPVEWFAVGLARQKRHYSLYVNAAEDGRYLGQLYGARLGKVKVGAASIGFRRLEDVDLPALRELLERADRLTR
jgi:hypothetical protein